MLGGLLFGRPLLGYVFDSVFRLDDEGWRKLTFRWGMFFFVLAVLNEVIWRNFSTDFWVSFKVFGIMPLTILFTLTQMPLIQRHALPEPERVAAVSRAVGWRARRSASAFSIAGMRSRGRALASLERADELVDDDAVLHDEGLGHAVDAPVDAGRALPVGADPGERIAERAEEALRRSPARPCS